ncbi:unnamed protein product [Schistosoma turkestanicum]|nr:unnamed protein product [Schistosoma turkestanicum]
MWIITKKTCQYTTYCLYSLLIYSISFLCCIHGSVENTHLLHDRSYVDISWEYDRIRSDLWSPKTPINVWPDFKQIQQCDTQDFQTFQPNLNNAPNNENNKELFEWTSVSVFTSERLKRGYILLGGSQRRQQPNLFKSSDTVSPRQNSQIFLCYLDWKSDHETLLGFGFNSNACSILQPNPVNESATTTTTSTTTTDHEFLGATSQALKINQDLSIFVYCDPLWRASSKVPVGRCFAHIVHNGHIQPSLELSDFCQTSLQVATPCAAGHSIALSISSNNNNNNNINNQESKSIDDLLSTIKLWIGQPLSTPYGRIQILTDLYNSPKVTTINRPEQINDGHVIVGSLFGYAVTDGFVTAPGLLIGGGKDNTAMRLQHLIGIEHSQSFRNTMNGYYGHIDWFPDMNNTDQFIGNGMSVLRVSIKGPYLKSVIVGAPYTGNIKLKNNNHVNKTNPLPLMNDYNIGRIYLFCQLNQKINSRSTIHPPSTMHDYLDGPKQSRNFGFALTNLGDFDGDGNDDVAIGAPDLENTSNHSYIYLIRLLDNCTFDRTPLQILVSPKGVQDFGAHLPSHADDLDFNGYNDLVVPISLKNQQPDSLSTPTTDHQSILVYATRSTWIAECHYTFPPWLSIRNILKNHFIPIQITVYFKNSKTYQFSQTNQNHLKLLLNSLQIDQFIHQINPDWNATSPTEQRFNLAGSIKSRLELKQNQLIIEFNIQANMNVEEMHDLESPAGGVYLGYRFLQPCYGDQPVTDQNGTCLNGGWLKRPLIDWSKCLTKIPLSRYICYPNPKCESDVVLRVKDIQSNQISAFQYIHDEQQQSTPILNQTNHLDSPLTTTVDIEYGNKNQSRPQLFIEIFNYGPTKAQGTRMELQFHGNLKFSRLELETDNLNVNADQPNRQSEILMVEVSENETWVHCPIGTLLPPIILSTDGNPIIEPNQRFILSTYYDKFLADHENDEVDFSVGAGVTIRLITGTVDPQPLSNSIRFNYQLIHNPSIRISYGPGEIPSRMDNRTIESTNNLLLNKQKRILLSDIGPKVEHTIQIEYMGPSNKLKNVTMNILVPIKLDSNEGIGSSSSSSTSSSAMPQYILYMFNEIRTPSHQDDHSTLEWIDSRPKITAMGKHQYTGEENIRDNGVVDDGDEDISKVGSCFIVNSEKVVNPREFIPMDVKTACPLNFFYPIVLMIENILPADLLDLSTPSVSEVIQHLVNKYEHSEIYTWLGTNILISINPKNTHPPNYSCDHWNDSNEMTNCWRKPHIFSVAEECLYQLTLTQNDQSIIITGTSGSGKTEATKHILHYLTYKSSIKRQKQITKPEARIEHILIQSNPLLEAFGNAKTQFNENSSRFGKYIRLLYNRNQILIAAKLQIYLLEKPRAVFTSQTLCSSFHVFRWFLESLTKDQQSQFGLNHCDYVTTDDDDNNDNNNDTLQQSSSSSTTTTTTNWSCLLQALQTLHIENETLLEFYKLLSVILLLNNVQFSRTDCCVVVNVDLNNHQQHQQQHEPRSDDPTSLADISPDDVQKIIMAGKLLGITNVELLHSFPQQFITRFVQPGSNSHQSKRMTTYKCACTISQAQEQRDCFVKALYNSLFHFLVDLINKQLNFDNTEDVVNELGILDLFGFECFTVNNFEQYCINYANERLHQTFMHIAVSTVWLELEQDEGLSLLYRLVDDNDSNSNSSSSTSTSMDMMINVDNIHNTTTIATTTNTTTDQHKHQFDALLKQCYNTHIVKAIEINANLLEEVCLLNRIHNVNSSISSSAPQQLLDPRELDWMNKIQSSLKLLNNSIYLYNGHINRSHSGATPINTNKSKHTTTSSSLTTATSKSRWKNPTPTSTCDAFIVKHYNGLVTYSVKGFVSKNLDRLPIHLFTWIKDALSTVATIDDNNTTNNPSSSTITGSSLIYTIVSNALDNITNTNKNLKYPTENSPIGRSPLQQINKNDYSHRMNNNNSPRQHRQTSMMANTFTENTQPNMNHSISPTNHRFNVNNTTTTTTSTTTTTTTARRLNTVFGNFKSSLDQLLDCLNWHNLYFIRCIRPDPPSLSSSSIDDCSMINNSISIIDTDYVQDQLVHSGIFAALEVLRSTYYAKYTYEDFISQYRVLWQLNPRPPANQLMNTEFALLNSWYLKLIQLPRSTSKRTPLKLRRETSESTIQQQQQFVLILLTLGLNLIPCKSDDVISTQLVNNTNSDQILNELIMKHFPIIQQFGRTKIHLTKNQYEHLIHLKEFMLNRNIQVIQRFFRKCLQHKMAPSSSPSPSPTSTKTPVSPPTKTPPSSSSLEESINNDWPTYQQHILSRRYLPFIIKMNNSSIQCNHLMKKQSNLLNYLMPYSHKHHILKLFEAIEQQPMKGFIDIIL